MERAEGCAVIGFDPRDHVRIAFAIKLGHMRKQFTVEDKEYEYELNTRGYYYELTPPVPVNVTEGRVMGKVKKAITDYVRKPGVDYDEPSEGAEGAPTETLGNP